MLRNFRFALWEYKISKTSDSADHVILGNLNRNNLQDLKCLILSINLRINALFVYANSEFSVFFMCGMPFPLIGFSHSGQWFVCDSLEIPMFHHT